MAELPSLSTEYITNISDTTRTQSGSSTWERARVGRITASNFGRVKSKVSSLHTRTHCDTSALVRTLMNYDPVNPNLPQLAYGRRTEKVARTNYQTIQASKGHVDLKVGLCGLVVCQEHVYLGASPDMLVECDCCGKGLVEIKCPVVQKGLDSTRDQPAFLDANLNLKKNHIYYAQIQGQMAVVGRDWCDFFVYTPQKQLLQRITFDKEFWEEMLTSLIFFWNQYLLPEIVTHNLRPASQVAAVKDMFKKKTYLAHKENERLRRQEADHAILDVASYDTVT